MEYYTATAKQLYLELEQLQYSISDPSRLSNQAIQLISKTLRLLRKSVQKSGFKSPEDEIQFFKHIKPQITGHLIFYRHLFDIESKRMAYSEEEVECYITEKKKLFSLVTRDNLEFVYYYQNRYTHMDKQYFIRDVYRIPLPHQNSDALYDPEFTTPYDHIASKLIAKDMFYKFLLKPLKQKIEELSPSKLKWTDSKISLVELIYGIQKSGSINNGEIEVKEICKIFEATFNVDLKDIYKTFHEISHRKKERTKYINQMGRNLDQYLEELDFEG